MTDYTQHTLYINPVTSVRHDAIVFNPIDSMSNGLCVNSSEFSQQYQPPLLNTVFSPLPTSTTSSLSTLSNNNSESIDKVTCNQSDIPVNRFPPLYQPHPRPYIKGYYAPDEPKDYSPHDSIESFHNWSNRTFAVLVKINTRVGIVRLVLRFHCDLTKEDYASLFSLLRKELKLLGIEWIAFGDVTSRNGFPINRLHFHFAFDTALSPEMVGIVFREACERAFYRLLRRTDFDDELEYQTAIARRYRRHRVIQLLYGEDFSIVGKGYVTDDGGSWLRFVRYCLKHRYSPYGVDPVLNYYSDCDVNNGQPLVHLFWKYKRESGTKSLPRLFYSDGWFVGGTYQQHIERYNFERRAIALSFSHSDLAAVMFDDFTAFAPTD